MNIYTESEIRQACLNMNIQPDNFLASANNVQNINVSRCSIQKIALGICKIFGLQPDELKIKTRRTKFRRPRQIAEAICYNEGHSLYAVAAYFLHDHCTVLNSFKVIKNEVEVYKDFNQDFFKLYKAVTGRTKELKYHNSVNNFIV
jgi:chromosomal replication initiation ATPase DnaA